MEFIDMEPRSNIRQVCFYYLITYMLMQLRYAQQKLTSSHVNVSVLLSDQINFKGKYLANRW